METKYPKAINLSSNNMRKTHKISLKHQKTEKRKTSVIITIKAEVDMRIGFVTEFSESRIKFAKEAGFETVEIFAGKGLSIDPARITDDELKKVKRTLDAHRIAAATLLHSENYGADDISEREAAIRNFSHVIDIAKILGTSIVTTNAWVEDGGKSVSERIKYFKKVFGKFAEEAEREEIKIGIENCPHGLRNIGYSPAMWELLFKEVPSKALGLEFDPSHLVWQGVDYVKAIYQFGDRIYAFHAKDTEIMKDVLEKGGIYGEGWCRYRIPGYGIIDWKKVFIALADVKYKGDIIIEHEDPVFGGERAEEGLRRGLKYLKQFVY